MGSTWEKGMMSVEIKESQSDCVFVEFIFDNMKSVQWLSPSFFHHRRKNNCLVYFDDERIGSFSLSRRYASRMWTGRRGPFSLHSFITSRAGFWIRRSKSHTFHTTNQNSFRMNENGRKINVFTSFHELTNKNFGDPWNDNWSLIWNGTTRNLFDQLNKCFKIKKHNISTILHTHTQKGRKRERRKQQRNIHVSLLLWGMHFYDSTHNGRVVPL